MGYVKLWDSVLDSPKIQRLPGESFKFWINALCCALRNGGRNGELPTMEDLEFRFRSTRGEIGPKLIDLCKRGLLDECPENEIGGVPYRIHDWGEWQKSKDPNAAARQARWREKQASRNALRNGVSDAQHNGVEGIRIEGKKKPPKKPPKGGGVSSFVLPDWIPRKDWDDWIANRKRKPTLRALELSVQKLEALRKDGNDPGEVLRRSVMGGWTGLFEIPKAAPRKGENAGKTAVQQDPEETRSRVPRPDFESMPDTPEIRAFKAMHDNKGRTT